ncbi:MAG TPA: serpin family protein [Spirochaetota bacterium]|nr:serpin family protein [Spirochaetota bacterium]
MNKICRIVLVVLIIPIAVYVSALSAMDQETAPQLNRPVAANNEFAFDIYRKMAAPGKNLFISPLSMVTAFSMVYAGSRGVTAREFEKVFHFKVTGEDMARDWSALMEDMNTRAKGGAYRLDSANRVWIGKNVTPVDTFIDVMKKYYDAGLKQLDFAGKPEESRAAINKWVAKNTNDKITGLVPEGAITKATNLVLTNAVYFLGTWERPFDDKATARADFFVTPAVKKEVDMMKSFGHFKYFENNELQAVSLPYKNKDGRGDGLSMIVLLPKGRAGIAGLEKKLTIDNWKKWNTRLEKNEVSVYLPRFEVTSFASLAEVLRQMGMKTAFTPRADFSGMAPGVAISEAFHKAYVKVNEKGTEAAAATAVIMVKANGGKKFTFRADHPFMFAICDNGTGAILFIGRVEDPGK